MRGGRGGGGGGRGGGGGEEVQQKQGEEMMKRTRARVRETDGITCNVTVHAYSSVLDIYIYVYTSFQKCFEPFFYSFSPPQLSPHLSPTN